MRPKTAVTFDKLTFRNMKRTLVPLAETGRKLKEDPTYAAPCHMRSGSSLITVATCSAALLRMESGRLPSRFCQRSKERRNRDSCRGKAVGRNERTQIARIPVGRGAAVLLKFDELAESLAKEDRYTTICTNAILIEKKLDSILKMSENLVMLVSLEGFEKENDAIRGKGTFKKVIHAIELPLDLQKQGLYKGKVSVALTVNDQMVGQLYSFMEFFEEMGVDSVYFCFPWYIPSGTAEKMDAYFDAHFPHLASRFADDHKNSWHSFTFHISPDHFDTLIEELKRVNSRVWNVRIRYQPALEPEEVEGFIRGSEACHEPDEVLLDLEPDGRNAGRQSESVQVFPEFSVGNLYEDSVADIFHGEDLRKQREVLACGLMPICSKCVLLYNNGV